MLRQMHLTTLSRAMLGLAAANREVNFHGFEFGGILFDMVLRVKPRVIMELGTGRGFTTIALALGAGVVGGRVISLDSGPEIPPGGRQSGGYGEPQVRSNLQKYGVEHLVELRHGNYQDWLKDQTPFDLLYVDVDNDGARVAEIHTTVKHQLQQWGAMMLFEGGSEERDAVEWMVGEQKTPIRSLMKDIPFEVLHGTRHSLSIVGLPPPAWEEKKTPAS